MAATRVGIRGSFGVWVVCLFAFAVIAAPFVGAETVRLKNGNTLRGQIVEKTQTNLVIDLPNVGTMTFAMSEVASIEGEDEEGALFTHAIQLVNENTLYGRIVEETADRLTVNIPGTGELTFASAEVASVEPLSQERIEELNQELAADTAARAAARTIAGSNQRAGLSTGFEDDESAIEREMQARRQETTMKLDQARQLATQYQSLQGGGRITLNPATGLVQGTSPQEMLSAQNPLAGVVMEYVLKAWAILGIWLVLICFAVMIFYAVALSRIAVRTDTENGWMAWIPLAHTYLAIQVARRPGWWLILYFVPLVQILVDVLVWMGIAETCGKSRWFGLLTLLPFVNVLLIGWLAFGKDRENKSTGLAA